MNGRSKVLAPLATVVAVAAVAVTASLVSGGHGGSHSPRLLRLAAGVEAKDAARLAAPVSSGGSYRLTGDLPEGTPPDAPAWTLPSGAGPAEPVARLAHAFKAGTPHSNPDGWSAGGLRVSNEAGRAWYFSLCAVDVAVSSDGPISCGVSGVGSVGTAGGSVSSGTVTAEPPPAPGSSPASGAPKPPAAASGAPAPMPDRTLQPLHVLAPMPKTPTEQAVRAAAAPILEAAGLSEATVRVTVYPGGGSAVVDPQVGDRRTSAWTTRVEVDANGTVTGANGWLGTPAQADTYPLISAKAAFDALPAMPRIMSCAVTPQGGCLEPPPAEITGAHLGLTVASLADGGQMLLPAWLFDVQGSDEPVAGVAVEPPYLGSGAEPGPSARDMPTQVDPGPSTPARSQLSFDSAYRAKTPDAVVVQYGDSGSCPHQNVASAVKESDTAVYVFLDADGMDPGVACTADYHPVTLEVTLQSPLGNRKLFDGSTGREVALSS